MQPFGSAPLLVDDCLLTPGGFVDRETALGDDATIWEAPLVLAGMALAQAVAIAPPPSAVGGSPSAGVVVASTRGHTRL